jgi:hypothetical protein
MNQKLYHFYKDEGGMLGSCQICISEKKLRISDEITYYYMGKLTLESIANIICLFKLAYPNCPINTHNISIEKNIINDYEKYFGIG